MRVVQLEGGRQATYEVVGTGLPTIMLAGGPGYSAAYMRGNARVFADVLQSHLIDPHGSGGSTAPADTADYSPEGHARFYEEVRQALALGEVIVFGHSFGATTALTYAAMYPGSLSRCIAVGAFGVGVETDDADAAGAVAETDAFAERHADKPWYPEARAAWDAWTQRVLATEDPAEVDRMMATILPLYTAHPERPGVWAALEEMRRDLNCNLAAIKVWEGGLFQEIDLRPVLGRITVPTLLVAGELDLVCGPAQANPLERGIPNASLVLIPECGHFPDVEAPTPFLESVSAWLASAPT
jgi:pimeloyl-ACP methyl ester carboxylesterase